MASYEWPAKGGGASAGVSSLNTLQGALTVQAGANVTIVDNGSNAITVSASGSVSPNTFNDTNSIDLTDTAGVVTADLNLSAAVPDAGHINADVQIAADGLQVQVPIASGSVTGVLSSSDWTTFNSKQAAGNYITSLTGDVTATGPGAAATTIANGAVTNDKVGTGIDAAKLADGSVSNTEFQYLNGATSNIQTQIDGKEPSFTTLPISKGGTNSATALNNNRIIRSNSGALVEAAAITASRALISDTDGIPTHSAVTSTELGYLSGASSSVQTQINGKLTNPLTTNGDLLYYSGGVATRLGIGSASDVLTVSGGLPVWQALPASGSIVNAGTMTIGAVTTAPTKGGITTDNVRYTQQGRWGIFTYNLNQNATGANAGSGDYLFLLPNSLQADTSVCPAYSTAGQLCIAPAAQASRLDTTGVVCNTSTTTTEVHAYLYSATQFRLNLQFSGSAPNMSNSSGFNLGIALALSITVRIPISGWS